MRLVVADASPLNYLIQISHIEVLRHLYGEIVVPHAVAEELHAEGSPTPVRQWIAAAPAWVKIRTVMPTLEHLRLDRGETAAIQLAAEDPESLLLIDERDGRLAAIQMGIAWIGTLGILREASDHGLLDLDDAVARLRKTNFRMSQSVIDRVLRRS